MTVGRIRSCAAPALAACVAFAGAAADERASKREERVEVHAVSVPVQVTLDGKPVRGLSAENFELFDRGKRRAIDGFQVIDLDLAARPRDTPMAADVPIAGRRHILFVFDLSFARPSSIALARREVREWLGGALDPTDLVAVSTFSVNRGSRLLLGFSTDRERVERAVDSLGAPDLGDTGADPFVVSAGVVQDDTASPTFDQALEYGFNSVELNTDESLLRRDVYQGATQRLVDQERRQPINRMAQTFGVLAQLMRSVEGRKYVVYLSEGFDSALVFSDWNSQRVLEANQALESGEMWRVDTARRFGSGTTEGAILKMLEEFRRADCVIHAVDLGAHRYGNSSRTVPSFSESLLLMANQTGGALHRDYDHVGDALNELMQATSVTYVLWFTPHDLERDGDFHPLKVKLRDVPGKAEVSHRAGYSAPRRFAEQGPDEARMAISQMITEGRDGGSLLTSVLAAPFRMDRDRAFVPVLVEIDGVSLTGNRQTGKIAAEIYAYAFDLQGGLADNFTQIVQLDLDRVGPFLRQRGLKFYGELELPPGEYSLRTLVVERESGQTGLRVQRLEVPSFGGEGPILAPPLFPEGRGIWLLAREAALERQSGPSRFPFLVGVEPYLPAAGPTLTGGSSHLVYLPAYNLPAETAELHAEIAADDGSTVLRTTLPLAGRSPGGPDGAEVLVTRLSAAGLAAGRYQLVLALDGPGGQPRRSRPMAFDVVESGSARAVSGDRSSP